MKRQRALPVTLVIMLGLAMAFPVLSWVSWARAPALGVVGDQLTPCPESPNAVSSQAKRPDQYVDPFEFEGDPAEAMRELASILGAMPRTKIVTQTENYLRAECVTPLRNASFTSDQPLVSVTLTWVPIGKESKKFAPGLRNGLGEQVHHFARLALALVLIAAGTAKLWDIPHFALRLGDFGLVYDPLVVPAAWSVALAELFIGLALVFNVRGGLTCALLLFLVFIGVLAYGILLGLDIECGCFGPGFHVELHSQLLIDLALICWCGFVHWSRKEVRTRFAFSKRDRVIPTDRTS